jgi:hypothetical protein
MQMQIDVQMRRDANVNCQLCENAMQMQISIRTASPGVHVVCWKVQTSVVCGGWIVVWSNYATRSKSLGSGIVIGAQAETSKWSLAVFFFIGKVEIP